LVADGIALVMYNLLAVVKAALRVAHGAEQVQDKVSRYYLADEVAGTRRGMEIAILTSLELPFCRSFASAVSQPTGEENESGKRTGQN
jgi:hypothetical protein